MVFGCPICSEQLERLPAEAQNAQIQGKDINISATPCGHLFHTYCINKWLLGNLASSKHCPCCRKPVPGLKVLPLFPNGHDESILDDTTQGEGIIIPCNCNVTISSLKQQLQNSEGRLKDSEQILQVHRDSSAEFKKKYDDERIRSEHFLFQWKQCESYKTYSDQMEKRCKELEAQLKKYQIIDSLVRGVQDDVESELMSFDPNTESIRTLLDIQHVLTQEMRCTSKNLDQTKKEQEESRVQHSKLRTKYMDLKKSYTELKKVHDTSMNIDTPNRSDLDLNKAVYGSRTPLMMSTIELRKNKTSGNPEQSIDYDIPLLLPFGQKSKGRKAIQLTNNVEKDTISKHQSIKPLGASSESIDNPISALPKRKLYKTKSEVDLIFDKKSKSEEDNDTLKLQTALPNYKESFAGSSKSTLTLQQKSSEYKFGKMNKLDNSSGKNDTIILSSSDDEDFLQLKGSVPGMKIFQYNRIDLTKKKSREPTKKLKINKDKK